MFTLSSPGESKPFKFDIRVIAATNVDLRKLVKDGTFREDLFYRINVIPVRLPPLRERIEDLPVLADFFIKKYSESNGIQFRPLSKDAADMLNKHRWPGNVRELDNALARAVVLSDRDVITADVLALGSWDHRTDAGHGAAPSYLDLPYHESMEQHSVAVIRHALAQTGGNQTKAAERLKLQRTYLARLIKQKGINDSAASSD